MGLSNAQFYTLLGSLVGVVIFGGVVFWVSEQYGRLWGLVTLNALNVAFLLFIVFQSGRFKNGKER